MLVASSSWVGTLAAITGAVGSLAAAISAWLSFRAADQNRIALGAVEFQTQRSLEIERHRLARELENRLTSMYSDIRKYLGDVDSGGPVSRDPQNIRRVSYELLTLYSQLYLARQAELLSMHSAFAARQDHDNHELDLHYLDAVFGFWFGRAEDLGAWRDGLQTRDSMWPKGFVDEVNSLIARFGGAR